MLKIYTWCHFYHQFINTGIRWIEMLILYCYYFKHWSGKNLIEYLFPRFLKGSQVFRFEPSPCFISLLCSLSMTQKVCLTCDVSRVRKWLTLAVQTGCQDWWQIQDIIRTRRRTTGKNTPFSLLLPFGWPLLHFTFKWIRIVRIHGFKRTQDF